MNTLYELNMSNFHDNHFNILDLPDEILLIIFEKLKMVDVLYSLVGVNRRFHRLVLGSLYIYDLDMTNIMTMYSMYDQTSGDAQVLSRICEQILSRSHHQVRQLTVEQSSMKQTLLAANYPQLYSLSLLNFLEETLHQHLTDDLTLRDLLTEQITHLTINIPRTTERSSATVAEIFALILTLCQNLIVLNFGDMFPRRECFTPLHLRSKGWMSSTLIKLKINVENFADCLYLLDGRLDCLSTLIINVSRISDPVLDIGARRKLTKLKCFSFTALGPTFEYDYLIVPLLCRMINLEELNLSLSVVRIDSAYIDGIELHDQFLIYMTQLKKFKFYIKTRCYIRHIEVELQSNENIQHSFIGRGYQQVASYVHPKSTKTDGECDIYSLPFAFDRFVDLDNSFQGGMFHKVRCLKICDVDSFEHKLFKLISQDFPFLQFLHISNTHPQRHKQGSSTLITFPCLTYLDLQRAHDDYADQFLLKENTLLPRLLNLRMEYESLKTITNNFTNDPKQFNFCILKSLDVCQPYVRPENFQRYFPLL